MISTLVINMARSTRRRAVMERRMGELAIPFEFVEGVDGQKLTTAQLGRYSSRAAFAQLGREMHPNEIGCILSHIGIWERLAYGAEENVFVIEDDMIVDPDVPALIDSLSWVPADARIVNLSWDMANPVEPRRLTESRALCRFDRAVMRTGGYIMTRAAAISLLEKAFPIRMPVDSLMGEESNVGGTIYGITPRPIRWDEGFPTETWTGVTMESFTRASRNSVKGILLRLITRIFAKRS